MEVVPLIYALFYSFSALYLFFVLVGSYTTLSTLQRIFKVKQHHLKTILLE